jgi:hypothetical protein
MTSLLPPTQVVYRDCGQLSLATRSLCCMLTCKSTLASNAARTAGAGNPTRMIRVAYSVGFSNRVAYSVGFSNEGRWLPASKLSTCCWFHGFRSVIVH